MNPRRATLLSALFLFVMAMAAQSYADISRAAVLFLRISPGARAAAMGESFVAVADDATATHYNPAGLGASPLSKNWIESKIPAQYRPLRGMTAMKARGGSSYLSYDIWALTSKGLLRFDNRRWRSSEIKETQADDTMDKLVRQYYGVTDKDELAKLVLKIAAANSPQSPQAIAAFRDSVLAIVPKDYKNIAQLQGGLDSLSLWYSQCMINWQYYDEALARLSEAKKGGQVTETKLDRIFYALGRTKNRYVPEQITMPYAALISGEMTSIASTGDNILVGTTSGAYSFNGRAWHAFHVADGLPSDTITSLTGTAASIYVGTQAGLVRFNGMKLGAFNDSSNAPKGRVEAMGVNNANDIWAVVDGDLYHFNGDQWSNRQVYTVAIDDTPEKIASRFAIYGTPAEQQQFLKKLRGGSDSGSYPTMTAGAVIAVPYLAGIKGRVNSVAVGMGKKVWLGTDYGIIYLDKDRWVMPGYHQITVDSASTLAAYAAKNEFWDATQREALVKAIRCLNDLSGDAVSAGTKLRMPANDDASGWVILDYHSATLDSDRTVDAIVRRVKDLGPDQYAAYGQVFRTLNGLTGDTVKAGTKVRVPSVENIDQWILGDVKEVTVDSTTTSQVFASRRQDVAYAEWLRNLNDLASDNIPAGTRLMVSKRPVPEVFGISPYGNTMMFATADGLVEYDGQEFRRSDFHSVSNSSAHILTLVKEQLWVAGENQIVTSSRGHSEVSVMYVKWLPSLASDLYYSFLSFVTPTNNWGTFGGNITYLSYGTSVQTDEQGNTIGEFQSFDIAGTAAYGNSITNRLKFGIAAKLIYSKLSNVGTGKEQGKGTSTGFAIDVGLLYQASPRLNLGMAFTNIGPKMAYIDANQADDLPRNLGIGFSYRVLQGAYTRLVYSAEVNKMMVGLNQGFTEELKQVVLNTGAEFTYANLISGRAGYIYDQEGKIKVATVGMGLIPLESFHIDVSWVPNGQSVALDNTLRYSLSYIF